MSGKSTTVGRTLAGVLVGAAAVRIVEGVGVAVGVIDGVSVAIGVAVGVGGSVAVTVGVGVGDGVEVSVGVAVGVGDGVDVSVDVAVGVGDGVDVFVGVMVGDGVDVFVGVAVGVGDGVGVSVGVAVGVGEGVGVSVGVAVGVADGVGVSVGVAVGVGGTKQTGPVMVSVSNVTAPFCAKARPFKLAPAFTVIDVKARMFPMNDVRKSIVAELPTLHHTLHGSPPVTDESGDVMSVDADLKIQGPGPMSARFPDNVKATAQ